MTLRRSAVLLNAALAGYAAILVGFTHWPRLAAPQVWSPFFPPDKTLHLVAYFILGSLAAAAYLAAPPPRWRVSSLLLALAAFALIDEMTQPLFQRSAEPVDFVADLCGILLGWAAVSLGARASRRWFDRHASPSD